MSGTASAPSQDKTLSSGLLDPTSQLGRWVAHAQAFARAPFDGNTGWVDLILLVLITTTIAFFWNKVLDMHLSEIA